MATWIITLRDNARHNIESDTWVEESTFLNFSDRSEGGKLNSVGLFALGDVVSVVKKKT